MRSSSLPEAEINFSWSYSLIGNEAMMPPSWTAVLVLLYSIGLPLKEVILPPSDLKMASPAQISHFLILVE